MGMMTFEPLISPALWTAVAALAVPLVAWYAWSRPREMGRARWAAIIGLMGLGLAGVLLILLNPTWVDELPPPAGKPRLTILVDSSGSMGTADVPGGQTRYQAAVRRAAEVVEALGGQFEIQTRVFSETISPAEVAELADRRPEAQVTDLGAAIASVVGEDHPAGQAVVLFSDGNHNAGGGVAPVLAAVRMARAMAAPVYCQTLGGAAEVRDLSVQLGAPQEVVFAGQRVSIEVWLTHQGLSGGRTSVALYGDGQELSRREVILPPDGPAHVRFEVSRAEKGLARYEIKADAIPGEATAGNNTAVFLLRTVDEPIRILLLEGKPYWDGKFLMRTLAGDPLAELDCVVRMTDKRFVRQTISSRPPGATRPAATSTAGTDAGPAATQPVREQKWTVLTDSAEVLAKPESLRQYQIVVLGRDAEVFLTDPAVSNLRDWVAREGGALLCFRGAPMAQVTGRLASMLPVEWTSGRESRFHVRLTELGREMRWLPGADAQPPAELAELPTLATVAQIERTKPLATVLATAVFADGQRDTPVVTWQPYGTGRTVVIEGAGMWRWAFLPPDQQAHDALYGTLWHSILRWMVSGSGLLPGENLAIRGEKVLFSTLEPAMATLRVRDWSKVQPPMVELTAEGQQPAQRFTPVALKDEPGTYRVVFGKLPPGRYRARMIDASGGAAGETLFDVASSLQEQLDVRARPELMARIAEGSGGAVLEEASPGEIAKRFREYMAVNRPPQVRRVTAWDRWWVLLGLFGVWGTTWALRRSGGLI
ncbi:MAG TPA: hypothetical protein PLS82_03795 [Phycisphaerae bacterium]|nr:hypothetical protein [Phycisphaerae bacterium]HXK85137.1 hypothetical protein [Phycisphaerae bacterium]